MLAASGGRPPNVPECARAQPEGAAAAGSRLLAALVAGRRTYPNAPERSRKVLPLLVAGCWLLWWPAAERIRMRSSATEGESAGLGWRPRCTGEEALREQNHGCRRLVSEVSP